MSLPYRKRPVYPLCTDRTAGLLYLLGYALNHEHSKFWVVPLTLLLQRRGWDHA
jgi:hypothetical protein